MNAFSIAVLALAGTAPALAVSCGTVLNPTSCQFVGPNVTFTLTNWSIGAQNGFQAGDILIDLFGSGPLITVTFEKNPSGPTPGLSFFANPTENKGFSFSYDLTLSPTVAGTVAFNSLSADLTGNVNGDAFGLIQVQTPGAPPCLMTVANSNHANCTLLAGIGTSELFGNIVSLTGGTPVGNVAVNRFSNTVTADFTPDASGVPEPSTYALVGAALLAGGIMLRRLRA